VIHRSKITLALTVLAFVVPAAAHAADQYSAQDSWERFSDKEQRDDFKLSKPKPAPRGDSMVAPVLQNKPKEEPGQSYVLMPAADPAPQVPKVHVETTMVPEVHQSAPSVGFGPAWGGYGWGPGWGRYGGFGGYGFGSGYGFAGGYGRYGGWGGGLGGFGAPFGAGQSTVMYHPVKKVVQDGPSKPSGNYFSPSTPDPTASGNYFASPSGQPKVAPIVQQEGTPKDYWGGGGNPLPDNMRSDR
jgi:hypothetical protein